MSLNLHTLRPTKGTTKAKKRVGRGNSSGHGTYSTRGLKGQKSRSGVSGLKRLGMRQMLLAAPKRRGFVSRFPKNQTVNLSALNKAFQAKETVSPRTLLKKGLIAKINLPAKILAQGELTVSGLIFEKLQISQAAAEKITKAGGVIKQ